MRQIGGRQNPSGAPQVALASNSSFHDTTVPNLGID
jgi:hypothetical protein